MLRELHLHPPQGQRVEQVDHPPDGDAVELPLYLLDRLGELGQGLFHHGMISL